MRAEQVLRSPGRAVIMLLAFVAAVLATGTGAGRAAAQDSDAAVVLAANADGRLQWAGLSPDGRAALTVTGSTAVGWDLRGLDPAGYRSDLARVSLDRVEGPGRFVATATSSFRSPEVLLDPAAGIDRFVVQVGRTGTWEWSFDTPGDYRLTYTATLPEAGGGQTVVTAAFDVTVTEAADPARTSRGPAVMAAGADVAAIGAFPQQATGHRVVIDRGHVDMGPRIIGGEWRVQLRDDSTSPATWRELTDIVLHARDSSRIEIPAGDAYAFLGAPGATVYVLPQVQQADLVWPGWNTQDASVLDAVPGSVTWRLRDVNGPGEFVLFLTGSFGQHDVLFNSANALPQTLEIGRNTHVHGNWAFTAPGVYHLTVEMTATDTAGNTLTDTRILAVAVGDATDPNTAFPPAGGGDGGGGTTTTTTTPGGTTTTTSTPGSGATTTTSTTGSGAGTGGGGGGGGGTMANTGIAHLAETVGLGAAFVTIGGLLLLARRQARPAITRNR
ncbi:MAG TPA: TIGR03773 family transporter-associated surface protein [Ilumatobacter sp.]|nr:TIGR03773 family transporter-associated surface protein [Ilumatobacter sp.]